MKSSGSAILVIVAFIVLYAALTGRLSCFSAFFQCFGATDTQTTTTPGVGGGTTW